MVAASEYATLLEAASLDTDNELTILDMIDDASGGELNGMNYRVLEDGGDYKVFEKIFSHEIIVAVTNRAKSTRKITDIVKELKDMHGRVSVTGYGHGAKIAAGAATRADVMGVVFDKDASPLDLVSQVTGKALGYHYKNVINFTDCGGKQADCPEDSGITLNIPPTSGRGHARIREYIMGRYLVMDDGLFTGIIRDTNRRILIRNEKAIRHPHTTFGISTKHMTRGAAIYAGYKAVLLSTKKAIPYLRLIGNPRLDVLLDRLNHGIEMYDFVEGQSVISGREIATAARRAILEFLNERIEAVNAERAPYAEFISLLEDDGGDDVPLDPGAGVDDAAAPDPGAGVDDAAAPDPAAGVDDAAALDPEVQVAVREESPIPEPIAEEMKQEAAKLNEKITDATDPELTPKEKIAIDTTIEQIEEAHKEHAEAGLQTEEFKHDVPRGVGEFKGRPTPATATRGKRTLSYEEGKGESKLKRFHRSVDYSGDVEIPDAPHPEGMEVITPRRESVMKPVGELTPEQQNILAKLYDESITAEEATELLASMDEFIASFRAQSIEKQLSHIQELEEQLLDESLVGEQRELIVKQVGALRNVVRETVDVEAAGPPPPPPPPPRLPTPSPPHPLQPYRRRKGGKAQQFGTEKERQEQMEPLKYPKQKPPPRGTPVDLPEDDSFEEEVERKLQPVDVPEDDSFEEEVERKVPLAEEEVEQKVPITEGEALDGAVQPINRLNYYNDKIDEMKIDGITQEEIEAMREEVLMDETMTGAEQQHVIERLYRMNQSFRNVAGEEVYTDLYHNYIRRLEIMKLYDEVSTENVNMLYGDVIRDAELNADETVAIQTEIDYMLRSIDPAVEMKTAFIDNITAPLRDFGARLGDMKSVLVEAGEVLGVLGIIAGLGVGIYSEIREAKDREEIQKKILQSRESYSKSFHTALNKLGVHVRNPIGAGQSESDYYGPQALKYVTWMVEHPDIVGNVPDTVEQLGNLYRSLISPGPLLLDHKGNMPYGVEYEEGEEYIRRHYARSLPMGAMGLSAANYIKEWTWLLEDNIKQNGDRFQEGVKKLMDRHTQIPFNKLTPEKKHDLLTQEELSLYHGVDTAELLIIGRLAKSAKDIVNITQQIVNRQRHERNFMTAANRLYADYVRVMSVDLSDEKNRQAAVAFLKRNIDAFIEGVTALIGDDLMYNSFVFNKADMNSYQIYVSAGTMHKRHQWRTTLKGNEEKKQKLEEWLQKDEYSMKAYIRTGNPKKGDFETEAQFVDRYTRWVQDSAAEWEWKTHKAVIPTGEGVYNPDQDYRLQLPDEFHVHTKPAPTKEVASRCVRKREDTEPVPLAKRQKTEYTDWDEQQWKNHFSSFHLDQHYDQYYAVS